jgi:hypothetical protein
LPVVAQRLLGGWIRPSAPPSVTIANLKFSNPNFQFRREICDYAVLVAAGRAKSLRLGSLALKFSRLSTLAFLSS